MNSGIFMASCICSHLNTINECQCVWIIMYYLFLFSCVGGYFGQRCNFEGKTLSNDEAGGLSAGVIIAVIIIVAIVVAVIIFFKK